MRSAPNVLATQTRIRPGIQYPAFCTVSPFTCFPLKRADRRSSSLVALVPDAFHERIHLQRPAHPDFQINLDVRVRVQAPVDHEPVPHALAQGVAVRAPTLKLVDQASVK